MSGGVSRRGFIGGLAASCALSSGVARAAKKAETPLLRIGIVSDTHCTQSFDPKDRKTWGHWSTYVLEGTFNWFRKRGVDAVVHPGDFTEYGRLAELEATGISWRAAISSTTRAWRRRRSWPSAKTNCRSGRSCASRSVRWTTGATAASRLSSNM